MSHSSRHKIFKILLWTFVGIVGLVLIIPVLLYIPFVQDFARDIAVKKVNESTGMNVSVGYLRLKFPLKVSAADVEVVQANGDTMLTAGNLDIAVKLRPLLKGDIEVDGARLDKAFYQMGNADSVMWLRARIDMADINGTDLNLKKGTIALDRALIDGGRVSLRMLEDSTSAPVDTTASTPWNITAGDIELRNITYTMEMLPTIDSLGCDIPAARLRDATIDMGTRRIHGHSLSIDSVSATYLTPSAEYLASHPVTGTVKTDSTATDPSQMWAITADELRLTARRGTYAAAGATPMPGFDMNYIEVKDIVIEVDSFYNRGTSITVPLKRLSGTERCGLQLYATGTFAMDSLSMRATDMAVSTLRSTIDFDAEMGMGDLTADPSLPLSLKADARINLAEVKNTMPAVAPMLAVIPTAQEAILKTDIAGTAGSIDVSQLLLQIPGLLRINGDGMIDNPMDFKRMEGNVTLSGEFASLNSVKKMLPTTIAKTINIPAMKINGNVDYSPNLISGDIAAVTGNGRLTMKGNWNGRAEGYDASLKLTSFPVDAIMPSLGIGNITAGLDVKGHGYNPMSSKTVVNADLDLADVTYMGQRYEDVKLDMRLSDGKATGTLTSLNPDANLSADFNAAISGDTVDWTLDGDVRNLNLMAMKLSPTMNRGSLTLANKGRMNVKTMDIATDLSVGNLAWSMPGIDIITPRIDMTLVSADSTLNATVANGDLDMKLHSPMPLMGFIDKIGTVSPVLTRQIDARMIDVDSIQQALPPMDLVLKMGQKNVASQYLADAADVTFKSFLMGVHNDSLISMNAVAEMLNAGKTRLDTVSIDAIQHGRFLVYKASVNNRPGTMDDFAHVNLNGFIGNDRVSAFLKQSNIKGEKGFNIGLSATLSDSVVTVKLVPRKPTIAYKPWTLNDDNFISYNLYTRHIDADLELESNKSFLKLFTQHDESAANDSVPVQEDIVLQISQVHLQDWLSISPFAPPIKGDVNANMRFHWDASALTGHGTLGLVDMYYGKDRVGTFDLDVNMQNTANGAIHADVALMVDSVKTITARGSLNDSTAANPFLLDFSMIKFPLRVVNPFLPADMARLSGVLNGNMKITGDMAHPVFNGFLDFDSTAVFVKMLGTSFSFSEEKIPVDSNIVRFDNFAILGCNANPLHVNGTVDARDLTDVGLDLNLNARNIQVVNSSRPKGGAEVYGKAYLDLDAGVKGSMSRLDVNADLAVLAGTNVTYVIPDATSAIASRSNSDMVHFVQFNDTTQVEKADSVATSSMALNLEANLIVETGSTITVDLSSDGSNRVRIEGAGDLTYSMSALNGDRLTGRFNINNGFVRYVLPVMGEKRFDFNEGSYISFNGDMMNPTLHVSAVDQIKANVTQEGQNSRLVNFDVILNVNGTLQDMGVAFDLATDDDLSVQNELASMSPDQRANQAMNMLLYNVYTGTNGTKGNGNLSGNALYSFLTSQLNSWAANNIRGVDISFGIDQYDKTYNGSTSTTTSYSYKVSKTLFNDRFKIIVGGNYSTDADADENFSQNLINDISFEYMLNRSGSMFIKIFRHTGYESILEGEVTQTGVGFVIKRKLNSMRDLFNFGHSTPPAPAIPVNAPETENATLTPAKNDEDE